MTIVLIISMASTSTAVTARSKKYQRQIRKNTTERYQPPIGTWYRPAVSATWQWQLTGTINPNYTVDVYDIDLFDTSKEMIAQLKSSGKKVLCYFSAGSGEDWRTDFSKLDASSLGKPLDGWKGEKWLDIRTNNVVDLAISRLDLAVMKGCDGVEPDNVDGFINKTGFPLTKHDQIRFNRRIAKEAHARGLTIALKNAGDLANDLVDDFDLSINEECHAYRECDQLSIFIERGKPIFNAEYKSTQNLCQNALKENIRTLVLSKKLDDSKRISCDNALKP